jgi:aminoglycoside 2''-phosphotransferase
LQYRALQEYHVQDAPVKAFKEQEALHALQIESYLQSIRRAYPDLPTGAAGFNEEGQNNVVLLLNEECIFRFPRYPINLKQLEIELAILTGIQEHISLRIPNPIFTRLDAPAGGQARLGYRLIPGVQLWRETMAAI